MDIRATLTWDAGQGGNYGLTFKDDPFLSGEWESVPFDALCERKAITLHLPEGWEAIEIASFPDRYALTAPDSHAVLMGKMIETDCKIKDGFIEATYTAANGDRKTEKIPFSE